MTFEGILILNCNTVLKKWESGQIAMTVQANMNGVDYQVIAAEQCREQHSPV